MATQVQTVTDGAQEKAQGATDKMQGYTSSILSGINSLTSSITAWAQGLLDRFFPPEQRAAFLAKIQEFMLSNPKLSTFLGMNIALTGVPLGLFILFTITVLVFSLLVGLILGLLAAVLFTIFCVGVALTIVLPFIFFTTMTACFLFLWGLGGYYILKWANGKTGGTGEEKPLLSSGSIGDSLNNLTGGKLSGFMNSAKKERAKGDISGYNDENTEPNPPSAEKQKDGQDGQVNGSTQQQQKAQKQSVGDDSLSSQPSSAAQEAMRATGVDSSAKKSANATGAVKGGVGGATGLS